MLPKSIINALKIDSHWFPSVENRFQWISHGSKSIPMNLYAILMDSHRWRIDSHRWENPWRSMGPQPGWAYIIFCSILAQFRNKNMLVEQSTPVKCFALKLETENKIFYFENEKCWRFPLGVRSRSQLSSRVSKECSAHRENNGRSFCFCFLFNCLSISAPGLQTARLRVLPGGKITTGFARSKAIFNRGLNAQ